MTNEALIAVIILLIGAHYATLIYRLHKTEDARERDKEEFKNEMAEMRKEFAIAAIAAANTAAQATVAAAAALRK